MKTIKNTLLLFIFTLSITTLSAQYSSAVGVRLEDNVFQASYKIALSDVMTGEGFAGFTTGAFNDAFRVGAEVDINTAIAEVDGLRWYYGAGAAIILGDGFNVFQAFGAGGAEYTFTDTPINLNLGLLPTMSFGDGFSDFDIDFALGIRYVLN